MEKDISILIAEDDDCVRSLIKDMLASSMPKAFITAVKDGLEALEIAKTAKFGLVILDGHMPGMDGHECYRLICNSYTRSRIPLPRGILYSGDTNLRRSAEDAGMCFLPKPASSGMILDLVKQAVSFQYQ